MPDDVPDYRPPPADLPVEPAEELKYGTTTTIKVAGPHELAQVEESLQQVRAHIVKAKSLLSDAYPLVLPGIFQEAKAIQKVIQTDVLTPVIGNLGVLQDATRAAGDASSHYRDKTAKTEKGAAAAAGSLPSADFTDAVERGQGHLGSQKPVTGLAPQPDTAHPGDTKPAKPATPSKPPSSPDPYTHYRPDAGGRGRGPTSV